MLAGFFTKSAKQWEHTRMVSYMLYAVNSTEKRKQTITEWMPLITDIKEVAEIHTPEEKQDLLKLANERLAMLGKN